MQTDQSACHSPIGLFQRRCYVVSAPAATGQLLPSRAHRRWRHDSRQPAMRGAAAQHSTAPGDGPR
jgi:hypothetical protein